MSQSLRLEYPFSVRADKMKVEVVQDSRSSNAGRPTKQCFQGQSLRGSSDYTLRCTSPPSLPLDLVETWSKFAQIHGIHGNVQHLLNKPEVETFIRGQVRRSAHEHVQHLAGYARAGVRFIT